MRDFPLQRRARADAGWRRTHDLAVDRLCAGEDHAHSGRPVNNRVPAKPQCSLTTAGSSRRAEAQISGRFRTGNASPVSVDSSACSSAPAVMIPSAGNPSPAATTRGRQEPDRHWKSRSLAPRGSRSSSSQGDSSAPPSKLATGDAGTRPSPTSGTIATARMLASTVWPRNPVQNRGADQKPHHRIGRGVANEIPQRTSRDLDDIVKPIVLAALAATSALPSPRADSSRSPTLASGNGRRVMDYWRRVRPPRRRVRARTERHSARRSGMPASSVFTAVDL